MGDEYICAPIEGMAPFLVEPLIRQVMAARYQERTGCSQDEAVMHATATWESEWESDPRPRTIELAKEAVDSDIECWEGDE